MMDLFSQLEPASAAAEPPSPPPSASAQPYGHLEHVGCRVVWHPGPMTAGRAWGDLPIRIRCQVIGDFYRQLKVDAMLRMARNADRRIALERFRQLAGDAEADRVKAMVQAAWASRPAPAGAADGR